MNKKDVKIIVSTAMACVSFTSIYFLYRNKQRKKAKIDLELDNKQVKRRTNNVNF